MKHCKIQVFNTKSDVFKVGVISDTQLPPTAKGLEKSDTYKQNFKKALSVYKNRNTDMILFAGDIGDLGTKFAFKTYCGVIDEVYGNNKPIIQTIMGNHDYWSASIFTWRPHKKAFTSNIGHSPWTHYVVNGFHFIGASPCCGSMTNGYKNVLNWLEHEITIAEKDAADKPIFVITHNQPQNTSYGAEDWGDELLGSVFLKHKNVIDFSGHVHYSLLDERSIWQGEYTVINTQSLSYTELEQGKENGTIPPNADKTPMGYLMEFYKDRFIIKRLCFAHGDAGSEEKPGSEWVFPLPYENSRRYSFEKRIADNKPPRAENIKWDISVNGSEADLCFDAACDDDFVHSYKVIADNQKPRLYFSDFYNGINNMSKTVKIHLTSLKIKSEHSFEVYAVDSWGAETLCLRTKIKQ